jgi:hypothetical protein
MHHQRQTSQMSLLPRLDLAFKQRTVLLLVCILSGVLFVNFLGYGDNFLVSRIRSSTAGRLQPALRFKSSLSLPLEKSAVVGPCAINLYGLPRKFKDLVLPSFALNVIKVNAKYQCDYFVHYYDRREESDYRGADRGRGGMIDPEEVRLLTEQVSLAHTSESQVTPVVKYIKDSEESFFKRYRPLLEKIHTSRGGPEGNLLYIPLSEKEAFPNATLVNIIKMWHSQQSVWELMEPEIVATGSSGVGTRTPVRHQKHYSRVAMFRSDVLYVTPIDIYQLPDGSIDYGNEFAVVPNFGNFPVNDRMIYGPVDSVHIWASGRFRRLAEHVQRVATTGDGIHPEKYLYHTIFPAIRDAGVSIIPASPNLCFLRVRADMSVRIGDCGVGCVTNRSQKVIESILQRPCLMNRTNPDVPYLECSDRVRKLGPTGRATVGPAWDPCTST